MQRSQLYARKCMEARGRIELPYKGFADPLLPPLTATDSTDSYKNTGFCPLFVRPPAIPVENSGSEGWSVMLFGNVRRCSRLPGHKMSPDAGTREFPHKSFGASTDQE